LVVREAQTVDLVWLFHEPEFREKMGKLVAKYIKREDVKGIGPRS
jgi:hypothetical protein